MIIGDFHFGRSFGSPDEADAELVVNADRMLSAAITVQSLQSISGRRPKVAEILRLIEHHQFAPRDRYEIRRKTFWMISFKH